MDVFLASILDAFKSKNPKTWALVVLVLGTIQYTLANGVQYGLFSDGSVLQKILTVLTFILTALAGSRTTQILKEKL